MHVRAAVPKDIAAILHHRTEMFRELGHDDQQKLDRVVQVSTSYLREALATGDYHGVLVEVDGAGIIGGGGVVIASWPGTPTSNQPRRPWILNVYVEPAYRGRGIGRRITEILIEWCRAQGFDSVSLHASEQGLRLYQQLGFKSTNEMRLSLDAPHCF